MEIKQKIFCSRDVNNKSLHWDLLHIYKTKEIAENITKKIRGSDFAQIFFSRDEKTNLSTLGSRREDILEISKKNIEEQLKPSAPFRGILIVSQSVL